MNNVVDACKYSRDKNGRLLNDCARCFNDLDLRSFVHLRLIREPKRQETRSSLFKQTKNSAEKDSDFAKIRSPMKERVFLESDDQSNIILEQTHKGVTKKCSTHVTFHHVITLIIKCSIFITTFSTQIIHPNNPPQ